MRTNCETFNGEYTAWCERPKGHTGAHRGKSANRPVEVQWPAEPSPEVAPARKMPWDDYAADCKESGAPVPAVAPRETQPEPGRCPKCTYEDKWCPGGAHALSLWEDGIRTVEDYAKMVAARAEHAAPATQHRVIPVEWHRVAVEPTDNAPVRAEPQELFPGANDMKAPTGMENLRDAGPIVYEGNMAFAQFIGVIEEACAAQPVEPGDNAPARGEPRCKWCKERLTHKDDGYGWRGEDDSTICLVSPDYSHLRAAQPATDDRTADTIPPARILEDLEKVDNNFETRAQAYFGDQLDLAHKVLAKETKARLSAETRIEVLEAALRDMAQGIVDEYSPCDVDEFRPSLQWCNTHNTKHCGQKALYEKAVAALVAPSGVKP